MAPLPLPLPQTLSTSRPAHHQLNRRYYSSDSSGSSIALIFGILIPVFIIFMIIAAVSNSHEKERKRKQLESTIQRQIHLHPAICSTTPGSVVTTTTTSVNGTRMRQGANGVDGIGTRSGIPDHVLQEIVRDVQRELGRVQPAVLRRGRGRAETTSECPAEDPLPPYEPRRDP